MTNTPGRLWRAVLLLGLTTTASCGTHESQPAPPPVEAPRVDSSRSPRIVVLGDSLTAGLGIQQDEAYPSILQEHLREKTYPFEVVNAGVSGDTSAGGLRRLDWALDGDVRILILALGANDGLRAVPVEEMKRNLGEIIARAKRRGVAVLLAGMEAPPNWGETYTNDYREVFRALAREHEVAFVPFLLESVAGVPELNQPDGLHPTATGARRVADHLWPTLERMVMASRTQ